MYHNFTINLYLINKQLNEIYSGTFYRQKFDLQPLSGVIDAFAKPRSEG